VAHTNSAFHCPTFFQEVIARCFMLESTRLNEPESYFNSIVAELKPKRDRLANELSAIGLSPVVPDGGFFMLADISKLAENYRVHGSNETKDRQFVKYMIKEKVININYFLRVGIKAGVGSRTEKPEPL
jgi:kynurenine--oxoglutarate transaminase/cysteine-S-conjugate beta-lyase/glutamine--phenylpyruvate transaminase